MVTVTNTTQLDLFDTIRTILLNNTTISKKFKKSDIYEFEDSIKSINVTLPYIIINPPSTDSELTSLNHSINFKNFNIQITMVLDFDARSKYREYANAIISSLEASEGTFKSLGYYDLKIDLDDINEGVISQRRTVDALFTLSFRGAVNR